MRIIGGSHSGRVIRVPNGLPLRPTTDFAREALFNILSNRIDLTASSVLDLFSGTGLISLEFASRGAMKLTAVDKNHKCSSFLDRTAAELGLNVQAIRADVFSFLKQAKGQKYDVIFADPPYDMENIAEIHALVFGQEVLNSGGLLIIEHGPRTVLDACAGFSEKRKYGNVSFSFFSI